jgi:hypothetical protein
VREHHVLARCTDPDMCSDGALCITDRMGIGSIGAHCRRRCREQSDCDDGNFCAPVYETELHACIRVRHSTDDRGEAISHG